MASKSLVFFLVVTLSAYQGTRADILSDALKTMSDVINRTVTNMENGFTKMESVMQNMTNNIQRSIAVAAQEAYDNIKSEVDKAQAVGANVTECNQDAWRQVQRAMDHSQLGMKECWTTFQISTRTSVDSITADMEQGRNVSNVATQSLSSCGWIDVVCRVSAMTVASEHAGALTLKVTKDALIFAGAWSIAEGRFNSCAAGQTITPIAEIQEIFKEDAECIRDKIIATIKQ